MPDIKERKPEEEIKAKGRGRKTVAGAIRRRVSKRLRRAQSRYQQDYTGSTANVQAAEQAESHGYSAVRQSGRISVRAVKAVSRKLKEKRHANSLEQQAPSHTDITDTPVTTQQATPHHPASNAQQALPTDAKGTKAWTAGHTDEAIPTHTRAADAKALQNPSPIPSIRERPASTCQLREKPHFAQPRTRFIAEQSRRRTTAPAKTAFTKSFNTDRHTASRLKQQMQRTARKKAVRRASKKTKAAAGLSRKAAAGVSKAVTQMINALASLAGGGTLLAVLCFVIVLAALLASPLGILFSNEPSNGALPLSSAIAQICIDMTDRLAELQADDFDSVTLQGSIPDWREVVAVFASKTTAADDGVDVAALTPDRVDRLKTVFWDMCEITSQVRTIWHPGDGDDDPGWTERILNIFVAPQTAQDMKTAYDFTPHQTQALDELLAEEDALDELLYGLSVSEQAAAELIQILPDNLDNQRRTVIETACTLVGKVNYFWGGKYPAFGWNPQWTQLEKVQAAGSRTTGTYRPYGLDCSGFVDWVFYNVSGGEYIPGHGGGAAAQHRHCTEINWDDARPGDLVFYPGDTHVGIVGGRDENGKLLIIHCISDANNVVITNADGFTSVGRPEYFD